MSLKVRLALAAILLAAPLAGAEELESMFDEANGQKVSTEKQKVESALSTMLRAEIPNPTGEQQIFLNQIAANDWQKATLQFVVAFEGTAFQKSANGRALYALTQFKAGMPIGAVEYLFNNVSEPSKIHPEIRALWRAAAPEKHFVWELAQIRWVPAFAEVFPADVEFRVQTRNLSEMKNTEELTKLYNRLPGGSMARARVGWQLTVALATADKVEEAGKILAQLMKSKPFAVSQDLMEMTAARLLYQRGFYKAAVKYYEKIGKDSEFWPDAQEEMAWSYVRRGEAQNALAISQSLVTPAMATQAGPESFFVYSISQLKICDYPGVIQSLGNFPKYFKNRYRDLNTLATSSSSAPLASTINKLKEKRISRNDLGAEGLALPRLVARDERLYRFAQDQKHFEDEAKAAEAVFRISQSTTGQQGYFATAKQNALARAQTANTSAINRTQELARNEVTEIKEILRKLHIVEAEMIQRVTANERVLSANSVPPEPKMGTTGAKDRDVLKFPADQKEVWFDEIGNYRVNVKKSCQAKAPAKGKST